MNTPCAQGPCLISCTLICIAWLLVVSGLLFLTWNKVVCHVTKLKTVKYWQALLLLGTICALCAPRAYMMKRGGCGAKKSCCQHERKCCDDEHGGGGGHDCPYSAGEKEEAKGKK